MIATVFDAREGERRKLSAHAVLAARRECYILRGRRALLTALLDRGEAIADDVRFAVVLPDGIDPVCFGVVPGQLTRAASTPIGCWDHGKPLTRTSDGRHRRQLLNRLVRAGGMGVSYGVSFARRIPPPALRKHNKHAGFVKARGIVRAKYPHFADRA